MESMASNESSGVLPEGIQLLDGFVIQCKRCKQKADLKTGQKLVKNPQFFYDEHKNCKDDIGLRPASTMTIRESIAAQILAARVASGGGKDPTNPLDYESIITFTDLLLKTLASTPPAKEDNPS